MTQHFAIISVIDRTYTTSDVRSLGRKRFFPLTSSPLCFTLCCYFFFPLLENKTCCLHSLPKKHTAVANHQTKQPSKIEVLGIFPWQAQHNEREETRVTASWLKRLLFGLQLCKILIGLTVGTNSVSQYSFHADRLLAATIYPARGQRFGKTNRAAILEDEEKIRICHDIFLPWKTIQLSPQSVPTYSSHFLQVISFGGEKEKAAYFRKLASSYLNTKTDKDANAWLLSLVS